jgi:hypothetical protein
VRVHSVSCLFLIASLDMSAPAPSTLATANIASALTQEVLAVDVSETGERRFKKLSTELTSFFAGITDTAHSHGVLQQTAMATAIWKLPGQNPVKQNSAVGGFGVRGKRERPIHVTNNNGDEITINCCNMNEVGRAVSWALTGDVPRDCDSPDGWSMTVYKMFRLLTNKAVKDVLIRDVGCWTRLHEVFRQEGDVPSFDVC